MILEAITTGLVAGTFGALVGVGGGVIMVPALILLFGMPIIYAIPASLAAVVATATGGTARYLREGHADAPLAVRAACVSVIGALIGVKLAVRTPEQALEVAFSILLFVIAWRMARPGSEAGHNDHPPSFWRAAGLFGGAGLIAGLLGVGGGILNVPAIRLALQRSMLAAVATSTMIIAFTASVGALAFASAGYVQWPVAAGCATGAFFGGRLGALLAPRIPRRGLQLIFAFVLFYVAMDMAAQGLGLPWWR
jgi:uncharacterized membrane protein YfcA